jgi:mycofactocin glycosyltransferase
MISASIVIPAYNAEATIGDTLRALLNQVHEPSDVELIVVDNGSSDTTREVVRRFPAITLLSESTRGPAAARNRGLHRASKDVVVHLDADTLPARTWLRNLLTPFSSPATVIAAGRTLCFTPMTGVERYIAGAGLYETERAITRLPFPFAPSLNMAVRRSAALAVGGWTEQLATAEDVDFSHRILKRYPGKIAYAREAVLFHRVRSTPAQLVALAQSYGQGAARMYLRYPEEVQWDFLKTAKTNARIAIRAVESGVLGLGRALALTSAAKAEFSHYHFIWSRHFARGFYNVYYRVRREA